jgi:peptidoglycan hydrolase CwlO-like protein
MTTKYEEWMRALLNRGEAEKKALGDRVERLKGDVARLEAEIGNPESLDSLRRREAELEERHRGLAAQLEDLRGRKEILAREGEERKRSEIEAVLRGCETLTERAESAEHLKLLENVTAMNVLGGKAEEVSPAQIRKKAPALRQQREEARRRIGERLRSCLETAGRLPETRAEVADLNRKIRDAEREIAEAESSLRKDHDAAEEVVTALKGFDAAAARNWMKGFLDPIARLDPKSNVIEQEEEWPAVEGA